MNPLFIITIFAIVLGDVLLSTSALRGERITAARWKDLYYLLLFLTCGWYFNHLNVSGVILYAALWLTGYLIASYNDSGNLSGSRVVLATLISSIALYILQKTSLLIHLDQGWLAFTTTVLFGVGETVFLLLLIFFTWDILHSIGLQRRSSAKRGIIPNPAYQPFVSIHLPISNEPVDVVSKTLGALSQLSYPAYEVLVVDNNTQEPSVWMPVRAICEQLGFRFMHVDSLSGYKAGALNLAFANTSATADLIAVVDADYELLPNFLTDTVSAFQDPSVAYLQTSQRNRNAGANAITRAFNPVYDFFYDITMLARSQRNSSIFAGSAGLIRCSALRSAGGWAQWSITEDAELSLRLLALGYKGMYINCSYGAGLMPETFNDVRKQWFRYFFGGLEIAGRHPASVVWARNGLSFMQRLDFIVGGLIVLGAGLMFVSSGGIVLTALAYSILQGQQIERAGEMLQLWTVFSNWLVIYNIYQAFGVFLLLLVFRTTHQFGWGDAFRAAMAFQSLVTTQAKAAISVLIGRRNGFIRTPKRKAGAAVRPSRESYLLELIMCAAIGVSMLCLLRAVPSASFVVGYLILGLWQMLVYGSTVWTAFQPPYG